MPRKVVEFEDGSTAEVQPFEMAKYTVSVAQFERFTRETGYKTIAEQQDYETFRDNQFISDVPANKRDSLSAYCISYIDALAYCQWTGVRLPTEAEWLAAAVIDDRICEPDDFEGICSELRKKPEALDPGYDEMTGTVVNGRSIVVRSGPYFVRRQECLGKPYYRRLRSLKDCEDPIVFRVCK